MHPDYRKGQLNYLARLDQTCAEIDDFVDGPDAEHFRELAMSVREELRKMRGVERKLRA